MKNKNKSWSEVVEMTLAEMSITFWFVEQCKGDTMFHAECFLDEGSAGSRKAGIGIGRVWKRRGVGRVA